MQLLEHRSTLVLVDTEPNRMTRCEVVVILIFVFAFLSIGALPEDIKWNYKVTDPMRGPQGWPVMYPKCGGRSQSPIVIKKRNVVYDPSLQPLDLSDYSFTPCVDLHLENHGGHTVEVGVSGRNIFLRGGSLSGLYRLVHFHFHWGKNNRRGSEHCLNGKYFPLELHLCHLKVDCSGAVVVPKQLAVVGFFIRPGKHNEKYEQILSYFDKIRYPDNATHIPTFPLSDLLPVSDRYDYFRYQGSLTTPPCSETVTWSLGIDKISISKQQMKRFRKLLDPKGRPLVDNFRSCQDMNGRTVYTNNKQYSNGTVKATL